jgi:hypothetical protein
MGDEVCALRKCIPATPIMCSWLHEVFFINGDKGDPEFWKSLAIVKNILPQS